MGVAGIRVANAQEDGQLAFVPEPLQRAHGRVHTQLVVELDDLVGRDAQVGPVVPVTPAVVGDDGVQTVVAARQGQHCQNIILFSRDHYIPPLTILQGILAVA